VTTLIVPIDVEALCVGVPDTQNRGRRMVGPVADFTGLPYTLDGKPVNSGPYISEKTVAPGAPFQGEIPPLAGIHLHWALPDGLTQGVADDAGVIDFPAVPSRWLLTRVLTASDGDTTRRSWVIESDRLGRQPTAPTGLRQPSIPLAPSPGPNFRYLGQAFDLAGWRETSAERLSPLTAVGYGEPTFAAFYPNCSTVFGFYDLMTGVPVSPATTISYHVAGWYADPADDPLRAGLEPDGNDLGWTYLAGPMPTTTVCSGFVHGIRWDPGRAYLTQGPGPLTAALAGSAQEALSALLADRLPAEPELESLLNALQFGLLAPEDRVDLTQSLDEAVHAAGFTSAVGGTLWSVVSRSAPDGEQGRTGGQVTLPAALGAALDRLNGLQLELDALLRSVQARRGQLFADWYKYLRILYQPQDVPENLRTQGSAVRGYLDTESRAILAAAGPGGLIENLRDRITVAADALEAAVLIADPGLELGPDIDAPRLYQPGDPVLVLSGPDIEPAARYGGDGTGMPGSVLPARLDDQLLTGIDLAAGLVPGSAAISLSADRLPGLAAEAPDAPCALAAALLRESFLIGSSLTGVTGAALAAAGGDSNPAVLDRDATDTALADAAGELLAGRGTGPVGYRGVAPAPILARRWATPWLPLLLQYQADLTPVHRLDPAAVRTAYPPDLITSRFRLADDDTDLGYIGGPLPGDLQQVTGSMILTGDATVDLAGQIERYQASAPEPDPELATALSLLTALPLLSQGLTGFVDALLMRQLTLQMRVADPLASVPNRTFVDQVFRAVNGQNTVAPIPLGAFLPLRTAGFRIARLRLVDVFGQVRDPIPVRVVVADALTPPPQLPADGRAFLPPRITQAARLLLRWRSATDDTVETNSHPATSPVLGWLLPETVDDGISLARADGSPLGQLRLSGDRRSVLWAAAADGRFPPGTPIEEVLASATPRLRETGLRLWHGGDAGYLAPFIDALGEALALMLPPQPGVGASVATLTGQPLALARAGLALDLGSPPAADQSWPGFARVILDKEDRWDGGLTRLRFPVRLGGLTRLGDTLAGFWLDTDNTFFSDGANADAGPVRRPAADTITLTPAVSTADATLVTLLIDPHGPVHATSGILPAKAIDIPPDQYAPSLAAIETVLACGPVLSGSSAGDLVLPLPKVAAGDWIWAQAQAGQWRTLPLRDTEDDRAALASTPQRLHEGWLRLRRDENQPDG
jgi:hypothetical protein